VLDDIAFFLEGPATQRAFAWLDRDRDGLIGPDEVSVCWALAWHEIFPHSISSLQNTITIQ
jgi:hypothetical protein